MSTTEDIAHELDRLWEQLDPVDDWRPVLDKAAAELRRLAAVEAERDALMAAIGNKLLADFTAKHGEPIPIVIERDQLRAEVEALRADAERWRAMRGFILASNVVGEYGMRYTASRPHESGVGRYEWKTAETIDAAIDEARKV